MSARRIALLLVLIAAPLGVTPAQEPLSKQSFGDLLDKLSHPNPAVRTEAVAELGRRRDPRALVPLINRLRDQSGQVRAYAAEALRSLGDERAVPYLSRSLEDVDPLVRVRAVVALGEIGGRYVLPALKRMLLDPVCTVRAATVRALGEIGDPLSLSAVLAAQKAEKEDEDYTVTCAALIAAAKLGGKEGFAKACAVAEPMLWRSWLIRATVAHAVGLTRDESRLPLVTAYLLEDVDSRVCQAAAGALAALGQREVLEKALASKDGYRRKAAVAGLADLPGKEVRDLLVGATADEDPMVVLEAGAALLARGEVEAFPVVIALLEHEAPIWLGAMGVLELRSAKTFGRNPPRWKAWFEENRKTLTLDPETGIYRPRK